MSNSYSWGLDPGGGEKEAIQKVVNIYVFRVLVMRVMQMMLNSASLASPTVQDNLDCLPTKVCVSPGRRQERGD